MFRVQALLDIGDVVRTSYDALKDSLMHINVISDVHLELGPLPKAESSNPRYAYKAVTALQGVPDVPNITICVFEPNDGTGAHGPYSIPGVLPQHTPRPKTGFAEVMIPIGTFYNEKFVVGLNSLEEVTLERGRLKHYTSLLMPDTSYCNAIVDIHEIGRTKYSSPLLGLTFFGASGNPHAIRFNEENIVDKVNSGFAHWIQVAAFIALPTDNPQAVRIVEAAQNAFEISREYR